MYIQPCANQNLKSAQRPVFKNTRKDEDYYAYMSRHSEDIVQAGVIAGALTGAFSARKDINNELVPKVFRNIGAFTLGLFGVASATYFMPEKEKNKLSLVLNRDKI